MTKSYVSVQTDNKSATSVTSATATGRGRGVLPLPRSSGTRNLKTPIRRFFFRFEAFKPTGAMTVALNATSGIGNKRTRNNEDKHDYGTSGALDPLMNTPPLSSDVATSPITELDTPDAGQRITVHRRALHAPASSPGQHHQQQYRTPPVPCMAIQNSDHSVDAVVISTLMKLPFCCHEDLLTMSHNRIIEVAQEMNDRLPDALKIDVCVQPNVRGGRNHNDIRREVERLVGIVKSVRRSVPGAPLKRVKTRSVGSESGQGGWKRVKDVEFERYPSVWAKGDLRAISPPTSPLAGMSAATAARRRAAVGRRIVGQAEFAAVMSPTKLAMLREEPDEEEDGLSSEVIGLGSMNRVEVGAGVGGEVEAGANGDVGTQSEDEDVFRAAKKRRTDADTHDDHDKSSPEVEMITPTMRRVKVPLMLKKLYEDMNDTSPTPHHRIIQGRSDRKVLFDENSINASTTSKSGKVIVKTTVIDRSLAHTRARYRSSSKRFIQIQNAPQIGDDQTLQGPLQTSTPKLAQLQNCERQNQSLCISPIDGSGSIQKSKARRLTLSGNAKAKGILKGGGAPSGDWSVGSVGASRIPKYNRRTNLKRSSRSASAFVRMDKGGDLGIMLVDADGRKDIDTNKTF